MIYVKIFCNILRTIQVQESVRRVVQETGIPKSSVYKTLKKTQAIVQLKKDYNLEGGTYLEKRKNNADSPRKILWTDETRFINCGVFNRHHWSTKNPHLINQRGFQVRFVFNLWCGLIGSNL